MPDRSLEQHGVVHHTALTGDIDVMTVGRAVETLLAAAIECDELEVDLSQVTFIDPCGARALIIGDRAMQRRGGRIRFVRCRPRIMRLLQLLEVPVA